MASAYVSFLKPKNNTIITQHNKANGLHLYSSRSSTLKCPKPSKEVFYQKKNFTNQNKTKNIDSTQNLISHRSKTENDENSNGVHQKSKSNNFIIKSKARTNESLYSPKEKIMESQRGQCWENPLKELDLVGFREELLMNLMNFDNLKNKNIDFEVLLEDNPEYFNHLLGLNYFLEYF